MSTHVAVRYAPDEGLPFAVAKARRECQLCGDPDARLTAVRYRNPTGNEARDCWLGMLCPWHIDNVRSKTRTLRVVSVL